MQLKRSASQQRVLRTYGQAQHSKQALCSGDLLPRSDLGVHIDGFIATQAQTVVVASESVTGRAADVIAAARTAFDAALRLIRPGMDNAPH